MVSVANRQYLKIRFLAGLVVVAILVCDQIIKYCVKTNFRLYECVSMSGEWAKLLFTENMGMAFGWNFIGTIALCLLRLVAVGYLAWFLHRIISKGAPIGFIVLMAMIVAGAAGNIIDNVFYGLIYTESTPYNVATIVPFGSGYGGVFSGKVVDMFYFPIIRTTWPEWMPFVGGEAFTFFSPIFNFADAAISVGSVVTLICYPRTFSRFFEQFTGRGRVEDKSSTEL